MRFYSSWTHYIACVGSKTRMDDKYENRYYATDNWPENIPSVCAMETDLDVFRNEGRFVPTEFPNNNRCLDEYKTSSPIYQLILYDKVKEKSMFPTDHNFTIPPKCVAELMIRLQRFDFRYPENIGAVMVSTLDGLVIFPNYNFIGEFPSEIGSSIKVYNSTDTPIDQETKLISPVGVLFDYLPPEKIFEAVTVENFPQELSIPANGKICVQLVNFFSSQPRPKISSIFYTSVGSCEIPDGVFMDDITRDNNELCIYNFTDKKKEIVFRENSSRDEHEDFLGYVITLPQSINLHATKSKHRILKIDLDNVKFHSMYLFKTSNDFIIPPKSSKMVKLSKLQIIYSNEEKSVLINEQSDSSFFLMKYIKPVSMVSGIKIITQALDNELYRTAREIDICAFNMTPTEIIMKMDEHTVGGIVCWASKLTGKNLLGD